MLNLHEIHINAALKNENVQSFTKLSMKNNMELSHLHRTIRENTSVHIEHL